MLKIKEIIRYFPHNLQVEVKNWGVGKKTFTVEVLGFLHDEIIVSNPYGGNDYSDLEDVKPFLIPLSHIKKDEFNFIYENEIDYESICNWLELDVQTRFNTKFSDTFWNLLYQYHFDVNDLITRGLANEI